MKYQREEKDKKKIIREYDLKTPIDKSSVLRSIYNLSQNPRLSIEYIRIDEPFGMDSNWKHFSGQLIDDADTIDTFIEKYAMLNIECITVRGKIDNVPLAIYVLVSQSVLHISYPLEIDSATLSQIEQTLKQYF